jgi:type I restriction enzyme S subunit
VIVSTVRTYLRAIARIVHPEDNLIASTGFAVIRPRSTLSAEFVGYMLSANYFIEQVIARSTGVSYPAINASELVAIPALLPPRPEQSAIAAFLDRETAKIDALIAEQQRLIELLQEKRQAVISQAVTKGLNPDAPMKDSGNPGIGQVPIHWCVDKMKWVARMESGHTPDKKIEAYWENCEIPWVSLNDTGYLKEHDYISDTAYRVNELGIANSSARLLPERVVVFSRDATIGRCAITTRPMAVSQHFIAWVCGDDIFPEYLLMRLRSMTQELERLTTGATLKTIGMPDVRTLQTPVPPLDEQKSVVAYIQRSCADIDLFIAAAEKTITLLQERRSALISAAVTGQIDVRGFSSGGSEAA